MKTIQELNESNVPIVIIDAKLDELDQQVLFPDKVEKARQTIARIGLPNKSTAANTGLAQAGLMNNLQRT